MPRHECFRWLIAGLVLTASVAAQWETNGPNARLEINSQVASAVDPLSHDVRVGYAGLLRLSVETGANPSMPLILAVSPIDPAGLAIRNVPGLGIINIGVMLVPLPGAVTLLGDGIGHSVQPLTDPLFRSSPGAGAQGPVFERVWSLSSAVCGHRAAFQSVVMDPSVFPFGLDLTEAADVVISASALQIVRPAAAQGVFVPFLPGMSFGFHGMTYSGLWVHGQGFVSFGGSGATPSSHVALDGPAFARGNPAIAAWLGSWDLTALDPLDGVVCEAQDTRFTITWGDPRGTRFGGISHGQAQELNRFSLALELEAVPTLTCLVPSIHPAGTFEIEFQQVDRLNPSLVSADGLIGHTPGGALPQAILRDADLHRPALTGPQVPDLEEHDRSGFNRRRFGWNSLGTPRWYNDIRSFEGHGVRFLPLTLNVPGDAGYLRQPTGQAPADLVAVYPSSVDSAAASVVTLTGKFDNFNTASSVGSAWVTNGTVTLAAGFIGVIDSQAQVLGAIPPPVGGGPVRDGEGLLLLIPPLGVSPTPWRIGLLFASGETLHSPPLTLDVGGLSQQAHVFSDTAVYRHVFSGPPVSFYGTSYTELFVSRHGLVSFHSPSTQDTPSAFDLLNGAHQEGNPAIAVFWTGLVAATPNARIEVLEDQTLAETTIRWIDTAFRSSGDPTGPFALTLAGPTLTFDHRNVLSAASGVDTLVVGLSDAGFGPDFTFLPFGLSFVFPGSSFAQSFAITQAATLRTFGSAGLWSIADVANNGSWMFP